MPPVKKNLKNGFNFYMDDFIPQLREQGIRINHKQEAVPYLLADWKALSKAEKKPYEDRAEEWKIATHGRNARPDHEKLNCFGLPVVNHVDYDEETKKNDAISSQVTSEYVDSFLYEGSELLFIHFQSQFDDPDEQGFRPMEMCIMSYSLQHGIVNFYHEIIDPGPPPLGMMAECRQHATQTHHIDPFNPVNGDEVAKLINDYGISGIWCKLVDFLHESQIKSDDDILYLQDDQENLLMNTFCVEEQKGRSEYCTQWLQTHESVYTDLSQNSPENEKYFTTRLPMPIDFFEIIKNLYRRRNEENPGNPHEIPTREKIREMFDKPLFSRNQIRCDFHHDIDCDYCSQMDCYRTAYLLTDHLKHLGYLDGIEDLSNHEPESKLSKARCQFTTFKHEPTQQAINYERRQQQRQTDMLNTGVPSRHQQRIQALPDVQLRGATPTNRQPSPLVQNLAGESVNDQKANWMNQNEHAAAYNANEYDESSTQYYENSESNHQHYDYDYDGNYEEVEVDDFQSGNHHVNHHQQQQGEYYENGEEPYQDYNDAENYGGQEESQYTNGHHDFQSNHHQEEKEEEYYENEHYQNYDHENPNYEESESQYYQPETQAEKYYEEEENYENENEHFAYENRNRAGFDQIPDYGSSKFNTSFSSDEIYNGTQHSMIPSRKNTSKIKRESDVIDRPSYSGLESSVTNLQSNFSERYEDPTDEQLGPNGDHNSNQRNSEFLDKESEKGIERKSYRPRGLSTSSSSSSNWIIRHPSGGGRARLRLEDTERLIRIEENKVSSSKSIQKPIPFPDLQTSSRISVGRGRGRRTRSTNY